MDCKIVLEARQLGEEAESLRLNHTGITEELVDGGCGIAALNAYSWVIYLISPFLRQGKPPPSGERLRCVTYIIFEQKRKDEVAVSSSLCSFFSGGG